MKIELKTLLIFGSRTLDDARVWDIIQQKAKGYDVIITALDPRGVCAVARQYAKASRDGFVLMAVGLDSKRAAGMHEARSIKALKMADKMLAIWDGRSKGTQNEIGLASKLNVPHEVITLTQVKKHVATDDEIISEIESVLTPDMR